MTSLPDRPDLHQLRIQAKELYVTNGDVEWVGAIFYGLRAAVIGLVAAAVIRIGQKALRNPAMHLVAGAAFVAIFLVHVPFPLIVLSAGLIARSSSPAAGPCGPCGVHLFRSLSDLRLCLGGGTVRYR